MGPAARDTSAWGTGEVPPVRRFRIRRKVRWPDPNHLECEAPDRRLEVYQTRGERRLIYKAMSLYGTPGVVTIRGTRSRAVALAGLINRFSSSPPMDLPELPEPATPPKLTRFWIFRDDEPWVRIQLKAARGNLAPFAAAFLQYLRKRRRPW